jgi:hypothetical protein
MKRRGIAMEHWCHISRNIEGHNIEDKIHCTVSKLDETWLKYSLAIYHYVKVQQLDDFFFLCWCNVLW